MTKKSETLAAAINDALGDRVTLTTTEQGEVVVETGLEALLDVATTLRDDPTLAFDSLIDLCGVDYLAYGVAEWKTESATDSGFSRGVDRQSVAVDYTSKFPPRRFAVVSHLLSVELNWRLRLRVYTGEANPPVVPSLTGVWAGANWFEREAFDLYGIIFEGHADLRRLLTDYGFIGHPFRKDFPLSGHVEVRYDPSLGRVAYEPVSIEPRTLVPKVIREDNRYDDQLRRTGGDG
ncbi:MAG: NADH-quinone oxidoreductase subunit C [Pseudomonadota bacterium]